jgi:hypothetical protein
VPVKRSLAVHLTTRVPARTLLPAAKRVPPQVTPTQPSSAWRVIAPAAGLDRLACRSSAEHLVIRPSAAPAPIRSIPNITIRQLGVRPPVLYSSLSVTLSGGITLRPTFRPTDWTGLLKAHGSLVEVFVRAAPSGYTGTSCWRWRSVCGRREHPAIVTDGDIKTRQLGERGA